MQRTRQNAQRLPCHAVLVRVMLWASGAAVRPDAARWPQLGVGRRWSWGPHPRMSPHATAGRSWRSAPAHGPRPAPETSSVRCGAPASTPMWWLFAGTPVHSADHACMAPGASQAPRTAGRPWVGHGSAPRLHDRQQARQVAVGVGPGHHVHHAAVQHPVLQALRHAPEHADHGAPRAPAAPAALSCTAPKGRAFSASVNKHAL